MTTERKVAKFFNLTDENWMKHSNPWSVWTRSLLWMFFNPIFFPRPSSTKNWASRSVLGERVFLNRDTIKIPEIHTGGIHTILNLISSSGMILAIWATVTYSVWGAILGIALAYLGKSWYLDRMVWLYNDMKEKNEEYKSWEY